MDRRIVFERKLNFRNIRSRKFTSVKNFRFIKKFDFKIKGFRNYRQSKIFEYELK